MSQSEPAPVSLDEVQSRLAGDAFWATRARAIDAYATLEQSLCRLFAHVGDVEPQVAGIIFFKIASADTRLKIIEKLFKRRFKDMYRPFINSLVKQLKPIDSRRNEIVHWRMSSIIGGSSPEDWSLALVPPNFWPADEDFVKLSGSDLVMFLQKCNFYSRVVDMFCLSTDPKLAPLLGEGGEKWSVVFGKELSYPPEAGHPLLGEG